MHDVKADVVIVGGGSGGYSAAIRSAELGRAVVLVEERELGGTCLHRGCIPTKALLQAAEVADNARNAGQFGITADFGGVDVPALSRYRDAVVGRLHKGLEQLIAAHNIGVLPGHGRLSGPTSVDVDGQTVTAEAVIVATGSTPRALPDLPATARVLTSDEALSLPELPKKAVILGGGVIGVEFASIWASFGVEVTVVEALTQLLPTEDGAIVKYLARSFRRRGIRVMLNTKVIGIEENDASVRVVVDSGDVLDADIVLVAVGRTPNTGDLGLEEHGVEVVNGFIEVDQHLRSSVPTVFAVGDVVRGLQLAHRGFQHGFFVAEQLAGLCPEPVADAGIPRVVYSHPEVASVGLTEEAARYRHGADVRTYTYDLVGNGKSQILKTSGAIKLIASSSGTILGVHLVGDRVGELIGEAQMLCNFEVNVNDAGCFIHAHPTVGEAMGEALLALAGKPLHVHA